MGSSNGLESGRNGTANWRAITVQTSVNLVATTDPAGSMHPTDTQPDPGAAARPRLRWGLRRPSLPRTIPWKP